MVTQSMPTSCSELLGVANNLVGVLWRRLLTLHAVMEFALVAQHAVIVFVLVTQQS